MVLKMSEPAQQYQPVPLNESSDTTGSTPSPQAEAVQRALLIQARKEGLPPLS